MDADAVVIGLIGIWKSANQSTFNLWFNLYI